MSGVVTLDEYEALDRPHIEFLIEGLIPKPGLVLLLGEAGAGKSFLALQIALAVAQGQPFEGHHVRQGKVLYLQFDMSELVQKHRISQLRLAGVHTHGPIYTLHPDTLPKGVNILHPQHYTLLQDAISSCDPSLIIIDVLREIHNAEEDDSTAMKIVGDALTSLVGQRACLILHHPRKIATGLEPKVVDSSRGSSYLAGKVDAVWLLHNNYLYIGKSRFNESTKYRAKRLKNGLWSLS